MSISDKLIAMSNEVSTQDNLIDEIATTLSNKISVGGGIPDGYYDTSSVTATAGDILIGRKIVDANGEIINGTMPNNGETELTIDGITTTSVDIPSGYTSGGNVSMTDDIPNEVNAQTNLIQQIKTALEGKAGGSGDGSAPVTFIVNDNVSYSGEVEVGTFFKLDFDNPVLITVNEIVYGDQSIMAGHEPIDKTHVLFTEWSGYKFCSLSYNPSVVHEYVAVIVPKGGLTVRMNVSSGSNSDSGGAG